jgi:hypothetical protein
MSENNVGLKLENLKVGDCVWFILRDGLVREGQISSFYRSEGRDPAVHVFDLTEKKYRYMLPTQLSRRPLGHAKKKRVTRKSQKINAEKETK